MERNGINKIFVVIEKKFLSKIEKYLNQFYVPTIEGTEIELVALSDEEESANVLKLLKDKLVVISHQYSLYFVFILERLYRALR